MHAWIITNGKIEDRQLILDKLLLQNNIPSINHINICLQEKTIGINQIKSEMLPIYLRPHNNHKQALIIHDADRLTIEAQNAILKSLEEPPSQTIFILIAENIQNLLPTIISRCIIENIENNTNSIQNNFSLLDLKKMSFGTALLEIDKIVSTKEDAINLIDCTIYSIHELIKTGKDKFLDLSSLILLYNKCIETKIKLNVNVSFKHCIDEIYFFISPPIDK
jgi:hypothetical protein